jgi:hypothetical protein
MCNITVYLLYCTVLCCWIGITAVQAVLDSIGKFVLPLNSTSYYRVAADLPSLVAPTDFMHGIRTPCVPAAYTCAAAQEGEGASLSTSASNIDVESFQMDHVKQHDRVRTLQLTGVMSSSFIEEVAVLLRRCGQQQQSVNQSGQASSSGDTNNDDNHDNKAAAMSSKRHLDKTDVNANIFKIDKNKLKVIDQLAVSYNVLNPFKLSTSNPLDTTAILLKEAQNKSNDSVLPDSFKNYFNIKLNFSVSDGNFSIGQTTDQLHGLAQVTTGGAGASLPGCCVAGGTIMTDVAWYAEDEDFDTTFEVSLFNMPELSYSSVLYSDDT